MVKFNYLQFIVEQLFFNIFYINKGKIFTTNFINIDKLKYKIEGFINSKCLNMYYIICLN